MNTPGEDKGVILDKTLDFKGDDEEQCSDSLSIQQKEMGSLMQCLADIKDLGVGMSVQDAVLKLVLMPPSYHTGREYPASPKGGTAGQRFEITAQIQQEASLATRFCPTRFQPFPAGLTQDLKVDPVLWAWCTS